VKISRHLRRRFSVEARRPLIGGGHAQISAPRAAGGR
jgi:hypothetical protein